MAGGRAAVVVPGLRYSADGPLLMYAGLAVERRGGSVRRISWTVPEFGDGDDERAWVAARVSEAVDAVVMAAGVAAPVVIGKSLGSLAAPVAADRGLPAVWLTPVLTDEPTVAALRRAAAPCLLIGGTAINCTSYPPSVWLPAVQVATRPGKGIIRLMASPGAL